MVTSSNRVHDIEDGLLRFTEKYCLDDEEYWIIVLNDGIIDKEDLQLWV